MHEIPKILTEKEFAKRLQLAKETLNEYNCKNDIEKKRPITSTYSVEGTKAPRT